MLKISPIKLLSGHHADTAFTGRGCFMNVVAYLNGENQITDESPCVCPILRSVVIVLNDHGGDAGREAMIPFISRAMGSRTDDPAVMQRRAEGLTDLSNRLGQILSRIEQEYGNSISYDLSNLTVNTMMIGRVEKLKHRLADRVEQLRRAEDREETIDRYLESFASSLNSVGGEILDLKDELPRSQLQLDLLADYRKAMFEYLDKHLPQDPLQIPPEVEARASKLVELATV